MNKLFDHMIRLSRFDALRLFVLFAIIWFVQQVVSMQIEQLVWGEPFPHVGDLVVTVLLAVAYVRAAHRLSEAIALLQGQGGADA